MRLRSRCRRRRCRRLPPADAPRSRPALQPDLDPKMRGRLEKKLEELQGAAAEVARKERERKYAQRYHKVRALCA